MKSQNFNSDGETQVPISKKYNYYLLPRGNNRVGSIKKVILVRIFYSSFLQINNLNKYP